MLPVCERVLGTENPHTLSACFNLAVCLKQHQPKEVALPYARRALEGWKKIRGPDHPETKQARKLVDELTKKAPEA